MDKVCDMRPSSVFRDRCRFLTGSLFVLLCAGQLVHCSTALAIESEKVRVAPAAAGMEMSTEFRVAVEDQNVPVYTARVAPADDPRLKRPPAGAVKPDKEFDRASFAAFDQRGPVHVTISCADNISSVRVLPSSYGISPDFHKDRVTFTLVAPRNLTIEVNGNIVNSLHLFASPFEIDAPRPDAPNVIYYGPGVHQLEKGLEVGDGKTLYIAGGAVLRGAVKDGDKGGGAVVSLIGKNIKLRGRGIIDGSLCPYHTRNLLYVHGSDISIEGVILQDSSTWTVPVRQSDRVTIRNVKVLGYRGNSDGIDICNSRDVTVDGCFLRTWDDLIVVKSDRGQGPVHHVIAKNCVLWNTLAHALSVGAELREPVDDVLFTDCDVIHDTGREWTLRVYHCDSATISNVRFENLRIEESRQLISLWIGRAVWSRDSERGHIKDVAFKNIRVACLGRPKVQLQGFDATHAVEGVRFEDVQVNGLPFMKAADWKANAFVNDVSVK
jgi:hypothetical protein